VDKLLKKKPHLQEFLQEIDPQESEKDMLKDIFGEDEHISSQQ